MNLIKHIEEKYKKDIEDTFNVGDTIKVSYKIIENKAERLQNFEGLVISISNSGLGKTFIVRKISSGVGVEKIFPMHSPIIDKITILKKGKVRRAKLYYMRERIGKAAMKVKEKI